MSGVLLPGRLSIILGPSAAGKTLLLNVLAGHTAVIPKNFSITGSVVVNQTVLADFRYMTMISAYVKQASYICFTLIV